MSSEMPTLYTLGITYAVCQGKGKHTTAGTILAPVPIQQERLTEFL